MFCGLVCPLQVVEENGMWKVLVLPHMMEFHPSLPVPPHLPLYTPPQPAMLHHPHFYPTELSPHYIHQLPALPVYTEQGEQQHTLLHTPILYTVPLCTTFASKLWGWRVLFSALLFGLWGFLQIVTVGSV